jgi:hypothetical protein
VATDPDALVAALAELERAKREHDGVYGRWMELSEKMGN